jgi:catechol 2,3-dioxygenase-like lactoylglutathione lyase family enzyme
MENPGLFRELHAAVIPVSDMAESRRWYEEILGLEPKRVTPEGFLTVYATPGPTHICLYTCEPMGEKAGYEGQGCFPNGRSDDIEATQAHLVQHDVECTEVQTGGPIRWFTFYDPDRNRHDVCEYGPDWLG